VPGSLLNFVRPMGTDGSNPSPSSRESTANLTSSGIKSSGRQMPQRGVDLIRRTCRSEAGLGIIAEARDLVMRTDERMWTAELERIEGELRGLQGASSVSTRRGGPAAER
jgi:hypothetical protein